MQIDPDRCINCAMCAMACPFGVLDYAPTFKAPEKWAVALNCATSARNGRQWAVSRLCQACKVCALTYGEVRDTQVEKGRLLARAVLQSIPGRNMPRPRSRK